MLRKQLAPLADYTAEVLAISDGLLEAGGEMKTDGDHSGEIADAHGRGTSPMSAALSVVGSVRCKRQGRRVSFDRAPFDPQEMRVHEYMVETTGSGAGMDPVGFVMATHAYLRHLDKMHEARIRELTDQLKDAGIVPVMSYSRKLDRIAHAVRVYRTAVAEVFGAEADYDEDWPEDRMVAILTVPVQEELTLPGPERAELEKLVGEKVRAVDAAYPDLVEMIYRTAPPVA